MRKYLPGVLNGKNVKGVKKKVGEMKGIFWASEV